MRATRWFGTILTGLTLALALATPAWSQSTPAGGTNNPAPDAARTNKYFVTARVSGPDGKPVVGANVEPDGVSTGTSTGWGGQRGFPSSVKTDSDGKFTLGRDEPFDRLQLRITKTGFAQEHPWLAVTNTVHTIRMGEGATIRGRVLKDGQPLADIGVVVSGQERDAMKYAGHFSATTGYDGTFVFKHLPPDTAWILGGVSATLKQLGAVPNQPVKTAGHGETDDLGDIAVGPGLRLAGQVKTRNGEEIPKGARLFVGTEDGWDSQSTNLDSTGKFVFEGLNKGRINVSMQLRDWRLTGKNRSLDGYNAFRLTGLLNGDKDNLLLIIEKEPRRALGGGSSGNGYLPAPDRPENRPIAGAEPTDDPVILLAGRVLDDKTGQPIPNAKLVPGRKPPSLAAPPPQKNVLQQLVGSLGAKPATPYMEMPAWEFGREETLSNGVFSVEYMVLTSQPLLRIEAEGYLPYESGPMPNTTTNLEIRLKAGTGPNGIVLLPDGKPAEKAVVEFAAAQEQMGLTGRKLSSNNRPTFERATGKDGKFSFPARSKGMKLFVSHETGWAEEDVENGGDGLKIRLRPWAVLKGTLVHTNGTPAAGVSLSLTMYNDWSKGGPLVNIQGYTTTDAAGSFLFSNVPPRRVEVQRMIPMTPSAGFQGGWSSQMQTWYVAQPGVTNDLGKITYDQPPPPSMLDKIKNGIGL